MYYFCRDYTYLSATAKKWKHTMKVSNKKQPPITEQKWRTLKQAQDMQIIHYGLCFSGNIWLIISQNGSSKMAPFWYQNLICLNLIVVLIKVKVNPLSISGRSLQDNWRHRHLNSRDSAFQNGDRFQVLTDFNGREDT